MLLYHVIFVLNEFTLPLVSIKVQFPVAIHLVLDANIIESIVPSAVSPLVGDAAGGCIGRDKCVDSKYEIYL
jgi:hypothetical protein